MTKVLSADAQVLGEQTLRKLLDVGPLDERGYKESIKVIAAALESYGDAKTANALRNVLKEIEDSKDRDLKPYFETMGAEKASEDKEAKGLAHGYASSALVLYTRLSALPLREKG